MKILFAFENILPNAEADAEVFVTTARHLSALVARSWLHAPMRERAPGNESGAFANLSLIRPFAPAQPAALRHFFCGLTVVFRKAFRRADFVYTRNLWVAWMSLLFGQRVVFDHYRPWPAQIPPLQPWIRALFCHPRFLANICHSDYTRRKYLELGIPESKLHCIRNGFEPQRLQPALTLEAAKQRIGVPAAQKTVVYTGRINQKKGLELLIEAAKRLPDLLLVLVGSYGDGPVEAVARTVPNIWVIPWQQPDALGPYIHAADVLVIPPSRHPMEKFGSTVLPLKLFFYMASGRPILAGDTTEIRELLTHAENAYLCRPDCPDALVAGLRTLTDDARLAARLGQRAQADSRALTWDARAHRIMAVLTTRLHAEPVAHGVRTGVPFRAWTRQSWLWLVHLIRARSPILPADATLPAVLGRPAGGE